VEVDTWHGMYKRSMLRSCDPTAPTLFLMWHIRREGVEVDRPPSNLGRYLEIMMLGATFSPVCESSRKHVRSSFHIHFAGTLLQSMDDNNALSMER